MFNMFSRPQAAVATVPAVAATAGETSSDTILIERVAAGDKLAMQALFAGIGRPFTAGCFASATRRSLKTC
jgi:hypothetical protein